MNEKPDSPETLSRIILDSLNDGLYVCDTSRHITYWSKSAERITGWRPEDVIGRRCSDGILCHVDKDGRRLCGEEFCPLHRSMVTNQASSTPVVVFGQTRTGERVPMMVSVAPIHDAGGQVVGGVETFTDFTESFKDLQRAKQIQDLSLECDLPHDNRIGFSRFYVPHDMIGGDFYAIAALDADRYGFLLADVTGHGVAAALYTMHLSALWNRHHQDIAEPRVFAERLNTELCKAVKDGSFATAVCGVVDAATRTVRFASAGGPPMLWVSADGGIREVQSEGLPFGMLEHTDYDETGIACATGDSLLLFTDGATEIFNAQRQMLDTQGLIAILKGLDYPRAPLRIEPLQQALLTFSNGLRLDDDLTLLELRFAAH